MALSMLSDSGFAWSLNPAVIKRSAKSRRLSEPVYSTSRIGGVFIVAICRARLRRCLRSRANGRSVPPFPSFVPCSQTGERLSSALPILRLEGTARTTLPHQAGAAYCGGAGGAPGGLDRSSVPTDVDGRRRHP